MAEAWPLRNRAPQATAEVPRHPGICGLRGKEELDLSPPGDQFVAMEKLLQLEQENKPAQVVTADGTLDLPVTPELDRILPESARTGLAPPLRVFVSYSHANYREMEQLKMRLSILQNAGLLDFWHDGQIRPGTDWDTTIHAVERALRETVDRRMALPPAGPTGPG